MEHNPILKNPLSLDSEIPLYSQLMGIIKRSITSGALKVGDLLPSEAELCRVYDISRNTVRQAIGALEEEGFVVRKRGKGTFVTDPNSRRKGVQYSFTTEISQLGKTPSSTLVDFAVITPSPKIVTLMGLESGVKVYRFTRVRNVDGEPLILETSYYPEYIYPNLTRELLETHSFYSLLYHVGVIPFSASDTYEAVVLAPHEAQLLHCAPGSAAFFHQRRTTTENGHTYEYTTSYMRADRVKLDVRFQKGSTSFMRTGGLKNRQPKGCLFAPSPRSGDLIAARQRCIVIPHTVWGRVKGPFSFAKENGPFGTPRERPWIGSPKLE